MSACETDREKLEAELQTWKDKLSEAERHKTDLLIRRLDAEEKKNKAQQDLESLMDKKRKIEEEKCKIKETYEKERDDLQRSNSELKAQIQELEQILKSEEDSLEKMKEGLKGEIKMPETYINFKEPMKEDSGTYDNISHKLQVVMNNPFILEGGQALVTFEEREVAERILRKRNFKLTINDVVVEVTASKVNLEKTLQYEINMDISKKRLCIHDLPVGVPDEYLREKLELTFYKPSIGGGEIDKVQFDRERNVATIDFLHNGVVERLVKQQHFQFVLGDLTHQLKVEPCIDIEMNKLQLYTGDSERTVLLTGITGVEQPEDDIQDIIEVYFQKTSNGGGEVERILYSHSRKRPVVFDIDLS
ncbi:hypothetical protein GDO86_016813 [Hymenochirus boettgeri]|uniref:NID domain-containing protein n=1 Tax=Hymenochirus boettgeri TaxID=247094 RepID=A0A8T2IKG8_9PIPI|nr:hypothetical protein GDO86_016813 [Hymenochirus boettgeri]